MVDGERFWDFSVRTYRTQGVPDACLALQNEYGVDVNLLLFCCWIGATRGDFEDPLFEAALSFSGAWSGNLVRGLREVRTWMKHEGCPDARVPTDQCMALREKIKGCEFEAEKIQQDVLESFSAATGPRSMPQSEQVAAIAANVRRYFHAIRIDYDARVVAQLTTIVMAALQHPVRQDVLSALSQ